MFAPVDKHQEMNIKDIKVTYHSQGPNIDWQYIKKLHPAIHVIRALTIHMEEEFGTLAQGKNHTIPKEELDITRQRKSVKSTGHNKTKQGRTITSKRDCYTDYSAKGSDKVQKGAYMKKWADQRAFPRDARESWSDDGLGSDIDLAPMPVDYEKDSD